MNIQNNQSSEENASKTIYFVWNYLEWGGVQIYFLALMRQTARKYKVKAVLPAGSDKKILHYLEANNVEFEFFKGSIDFSKAETLGQRIVRRWNDFRANLALASHMSKYDLSDSIVQIDVAPWGGFGLLLYLTLKTDVFVTFHTRMPEITAAKRILWQTKFAILTAFRRFHIASSNLDVKQSLQPYVTNSRFQQIEVIYSSINGEEIEEVLKTRITRQEIAAKYDFPDDKLWICNVAQFIERKGCWIFLETIELLLKRRKDLFFYWLGTAPLNENMLARIEKYELEGNFRFLSAEETGTSRNDLLTLLKAADLFVLPSFQEGLPMSLVEAMALGKACIVSRINAIPEAVKDFETGILVDAGNSQKLAEAIEVLANDSALRQKLGENAGILATRNFEEKITGKIMLHLYEKSGRGQGRR